LEVVVAAAEQPESGAAAARVVKSADRTLDVLEELARSTGPLALGELSRRLSIPKSSLHGLLRTLERRSWVEVDDGGLRFSLGVRAMQVAGSYLDHDRVLAAAQQALDTIANETGETVQLARFDAADIVYLAQRQARHPVRLISSIGQRLPAHATALGKALLATLPGRARTSLLAEQGMRPFTPATVTEPAEIEAEVTRLRPGDLVTEYGQYRPEVCCAGVAIPDSGGWWALGSSARGLSLPGPLLAELQVAAADLSRAAG
jgi:DNA-binding IclR family transcriptional regulator